jgi:broad specificity polyphosphatase/5'/3'-nucleotidase SurE
MAIHWTTFFQSIQVSSVAIGTITFSTFPLFVTFLEPVIYKERLTLQNVLLAIGFSLLNHNPEADFTPCIPFVRHIIGTTLERGGLPLGISLNVNIPRLPADEIKGIRVCHEAHAMWHDSFEKRTDPQGRPYWWLTGKFVCDNPPEASDVWALDHGYVSVVPIHPDFTHYPALHELDHMFNS